MEWKKGKGEVRKQEKQIKRICVFCGSRKGHNPAFTEATHDLGKEMVKRKLDLVYGGGSSGLMGVLAETVHDGGCNVIGIIPRALMSREVRQTVGETRIVADMHERKKEMARLADIFIALPGGYGTLEELLEIITWAQLGIHHKTVGLLNVDGYYNNLLAMLDKGVQEGFIESTERIICVSADTVEELMDKMNLSYVVDVEEKTSKKRKRSI